MGYRKNRVYVGNKLHLDFGWWRVGVEYKEVRLKKMELRKRAKMLRHD